MEERETSPVRPPSPERGNAAKSLRYVLSPLRWVKIPRVPARQYLATAALFLLLCLFLAILDPLVYEPLANYDEYLLEFSVLKLIYLLSLFPVFTLSLLFLLLSSSVVVRGFTYMFLFCTLTLFITYKDVNTYGFGLEEAIVALNAMGEVQGAVQGYLLSVVKAIAWATLAVGIMIVLIERYMPLRIVWPLSVFPALALSIGYSLTSIGGSDIIYMPAPFKVTLGSYYAYTHSIYHGPRNPVRMEAAISTPFDRIILVMDESVRGDQLGINGAQDGVTPFLEANSHQIFNYGIASSGSNCSANSNIMVQSGVTPAQLNEGGQEVLTNPSLFQYAKAAGYKTIFIDGQNSSDEPTNFMTRYDFDSIDLYRQPLMETADLEPHLVDREIGGQLAELVRNDDRFFAYVVKHGAHFPYEGKYPGNRRHFEPTLDVSLSQSLGPENWSELEDAERRTNSYLNALRWSVDGFFEKLLREVAQADVLILYTADHGQSLLEDGAKLTHCSARNPPVAQANVPLLVFAGGRYFEEFDALARGSLRSNQNRASHFQVAPTILQLMGYEPSEFRQSKGKTLFDALDEERFFYTGRVWGNVTKNAFTQ